MIKGELKTTNVYASPTMYSEIFVFLWVKSS